MSATLVPVVMVIVVMSFLLASASRKPLVRDGLQVLRFSEGWRWFVRLLWLFPAGVATVTAISRPNPGEGWIAVTLVLASSAVCALFSLEVLRREIIVSDTGVRQVSAWSKPVTIAWKDVREVEVTLSSDVMVRARNGSSVRVSLYLSGLDALVAALQSRVPAVPDVPGVIRKIRGFRVRGHPYRCSASGCGGNEPFPESVRGDTALPDHGRLSSAPSTHNA